MIRGFLLPTILPIILPTLLPMLLLIKQVTKLTNFLSISPAKKNDYRLVYVYILAVYKAEPFINKTAISHCHAMMMIFFFLSLDESSHGIKVCVE
jgi:hypothetical protein